VPTQLIVCYCGFLSFRVGSNCEFRFARDGCRSLQRPEVKQNSRRRTRRMGFGSSYSIIHQLSTKACAQRTAAIAWTYW